MKLIASYETEDFASINEFANVLEAKLQEKGGATYASAVEIANGDKKDDANNPNPYVSAASAVQYMRDAAAALRIYENYK